nr:fumarate reductase (CoM/CoB) subunit TfrB [Methanocaldococcus infernus]
MITIKINREGKIEKYKVPENLTVLEALEYINREYGANIKFRASCRNSQCGSCALTINGSPRLACETLVKDNMLIEPLRGFRVVKDLIVDREPYYQKLKSIRNYIVRKKLPNGLEEIEESEVEKTKELRACIDCLSCLSTCPARSSSNFPGATVMRQLLRFSLDKRDEEDRERIAFFENLYFCTTCSSCVEVCPMNIKLERAIEKLRELAFKKGYFLEEHRKVRENILKSNRSIPKIKESFLEKAKEFYKAENEKLRVAFFTGCLIDYRNIAVGFDTIEVLLAHNISVYLPKAQVCCGSPMLRTGQRDVAEDLMEKNLETLESLDIDYIVTVCAGCGSTLKNDYKLKNVKDISELLIEFEREYKKLKLRVSYHDPCHLRRGQNVYKEPRELIKRIPGIEFLDSKPQCCGAGGGVRSGVKELAKLLGKRRAKQFRDVDKVITICPFCELHLKEQGLDVINLVSLLKKVI